MILHYAHEALLAQMSTRSENRLNRLARKEDMNALFDNIVQSLQLEEQKFSELISNGVHFSTSLYTMLKPAINRYHKA